MPNHLKSEGNGHTEILLVQYPDRPQYEVRVYVADAPHDHRTLIATDNINEAEKIFRQRVAKL